MKKNGLLFLVCIFFLFLNPVYAATTADVVFVVDESGSMSGEHAWIKTMVDNLNDELVLAGVTNNRYALVGFGSTATPTLHTLAGLGDVTTFKSAADSLVAHGSTEDGWAAMDYAFNDAGFSFRSGAAVNVILITDEDRDNTDNTLSYNGLLNMFTSRNAMLNAVVVANFGSGVLGVDSDKNAFSADGSGGYTTAAGGGVISDYGTTTEDYVNMAWGTAGAAWNLDLLRGSTLSAESFTKAFVDIKVDEIVQQPPTVPVPGSLLLLGAGLLGFAGAGRNKRLLA